ncbi:MAG: trypsin-like peptidase domain-containing protein, partial [Pirellulaceae bacterium]|nr:trypsin-like peptidase domain-containing protein [Pirellulaceae bacterium]
MGFSLRPNTPGIMATLIMLLLVLLNVPAHSFAQEPALDVEKIADQTRPSLVSISSTGREGRSQGIGTGFVVDKDGLIATNYHVIGDARPIHVEMSDGRKLRVTAIHASDRKMDLAVIRVAEKDLPALSLGNPENLRKGAPIVVMGNPHGLKNSVVSGVNSSMREIDGRTMLQLAIPIEPGNSGGPVLDRQGNVHGIVTMKSLVTDNLGFAVDIRMLQTLLAKPNPVPIDRWMTIGTIDARDWQPLFGARWRQRGGRIMVEDSGEGFAGRSLCLSSQPIPAAPYEISVAVKLNKEAGAAGLVFHADGKNRHYGFYPSSGKIRLTRFDGADVFTWQVLYDQPCEAYRPGEWNTLRVRMEKDQFLCYVNDQLILTSQDRGLPTGRAGLAKFRDTHAQFRHFRIGKNLGRGDLPKELATRLNQLIDDLPRLEAISDQQLEPLQEHSTDTRDLLRRQAESLRSRAAELKQISADIHARSLAVKLNRIFPDLAGKEKPDPATTDLLQAALLIAVLDEEEIDTQAYVKLIERMANDILAAIKKDASQADKLAALDKYLFQDNGFHGSRFDYYHRANSYLNRVIDDREGLPITLSVLYMELGRRLGLKIEGVGLPGHFIVRHVNQDGKGQLIDVFNEGKRLTREDAIKLAAEHSNQPFQDAYLAPVPSRQILIRMLNNLMSLAQQKEDKESMLRYV